MAHKLKLKQEVIKKDIKHKRKYGYWIIVSEQISNIPVSNMLVFACMSVLWQKYTAIRFLARGHISHSVLVTTLHTYLHCKH